MGVAARRCLVFSPRGSSGGAAGTHYYGSSTAQKAGQRWVGGGLQQPDSLTPPGVNISAIQQLNGNLSPRMCGAAAQGLGPGIGGDHTITTCHVTSKMCHVLCRIDSKSIFWETVLWRFFFPDDAKQNRWNDCNSARFTAVVTQEASGVAALVMFADTLTFRRLSDFE